MLAMWGLPEVGPPLLSGNYSPGLGWRHQFCRDGMTTPFCGQLSGEYPLHTLCADALARFVLLPPVAVIPFLFSICLGFVRGSGAS